jgi:Holliday junction resolvase-like predicted endonuclease
MIMNMLTENQVVDAVCEFLLSQGWQIDSKAQTTQKGHDIVARKDRTILIIEAKGETSDRKGSARHGKPFDSAQCRDHVANALFSAAEAFQISLPLNKRLLGIALPKTKMHQKLIDQIKVALDVLEIAVFWVGQDKKVTIVSKNPLDMNAA